MSLQECRSGFNELKTAYPEIDFKENINEGELNYPKGCNIHWEKLVSGSNAMWRASASHSVNRNNLRPICKIPRT